MDRRQFAMLGLAASVRLLGQQSCEPPASDTKKPVSFKSSEIPTRVKKIVVEQLGAEADKVTDAARFREDLGADSLDIVELIMAFEEAFDLEITEEESDKFKTVGDAVKLVMDKLKSAKRLTDEN